MKTKELGKLFRIIIQEPDKNWKKQFKIERELIIEHIGSTAIPNLRTKPTLLKTLIN